MRVVSWWHVFPFSHHMSLCTDCLTYAEFRLPLFHYSRTILDQRLSIVPMRRKAPYRQVTE